MNTVPDNQDFLTVICVECGKPIERNDLASSVMVKVWVPSRGLYVDEGPFHESCGQQYNKRHNKG